MRKLIPIIFLFIFCGTISAQRDITFSKSNFKNDVAGLKKAKEDAYQKNRRTEFKILKN